MCRPIQWQGRFWTLADLWVRPAEGFTKFPLEWVTATHFPEVKRHGETDSLFPSSAEIKNEWSYTSPQYICLHGAHRANTNLYYRTDSAGRPTKSGIVGLHAAAYVAMELNRHFCTEYTPPFACCCPSENGCTFFQHHLQSKPVV
jgi:hypothetical protein